ncbi:MAG: 16S rRNA (guanine(966)-N(2))-methyltransferase RsmD [Thermodesulfobacteriota bacterium]
MRVIGGKAKGRKLLSARGLTTRPTADKIKESIFNILSCDFKDKEVLDLFAGTGNLGIEALSRGASKAVFIESSRHVLPVLEKNLRNCGFTDISQIIGTTVEKGIKILERRGNRFDFIFLDPPYIKGILKDALVKISQSDILKDTSLVIAEHSSSEMVEGGIEGLTLADQRRYGTTIISFFEFFKKTN